MNWTRYYEAVRRYGNLWFNPWNFPTEYKFVQESGKTKAVAKTYGEIKAEWESELARIQNGITYFESLVPGTFRYNINNPEKNLPRYYAWAANYQAALSELPSQNPNDPAPNPQFIVTEYNHDNISFYNYLYGWIN